MRLNTVQLANQVRKLKQFHTTRKINKIIHWRDRHFSNKMQIDKVINTRILGEKAKPISYQKGKDIRHITP